MKSEPKPRRGTFLGLEITNQHLGEGTWIEGEEFCYPAGGYTRRAYALCADGKKRVFSCSVADSYFSVPARGKINYRYVKGFVSIHDNILYFKEAKLAEDTQHD